MSFAPPVNQNKHSISKTTQNRVNQDSKNFESKLKMLEHSATESSSDSKEFEILVPLISQVPNFLELEDSFGKALEEFQNIEKELESQTNILKKLLNTSEAVESEELQFPDNDNSKLNLDIDECRNMLLITPVQRNIEMKKVEILLKEEIIGVLSQISSEFSTYKDEVEAELGTFKAEVEVIVPELIYEEELTLLENDADWLKDELNKVVEQSVEELNSELEMKQYQFRQSIQQEILSLKSFMQVIRLEARENDELLLNDEMPISEKFNKLSERTNQDIMNVLGYVISGLEILDEKINSAVEFNESFQEKLKEDNAKSLIYDEETKESLREEIKGVEVSVDEAKNSHDLIKTNSNKNFGKIKESVEVIETLQRQLARSGSPRQEDYRGKANMTEEKVNEKLKEVGDILKDVYSQLRVSREMLETQSFANFQTNLLADSNTFVVSFKEPPPFRNVQPGTTPTNIPLDEDNF